MMEAYSFLVRIRNEEKERMKVECHFLLVLHLFLRLELLLSRSGLCCPTGREVKRHQKDEKGWTETKKGKKKGRMQFPLDPSLISAFGALIATFRSVCPWEKMRNLRSETKKERKKVDCVVTSSSLAFFCLWNLVATFFSSSSSEFLLFYFLYSLSSPFVCCFVIDCLPFLSLYPLLRKDGLSLPYLILHAAWLLLTRDFHTPSPSSSSPYRSHPLTLLDSTSSSSSASSSDRFPSFSSSSSGFSSSTSEQLRQRKPGVGENVADSTSPSSSSSSSCVSGSSAVLHGCSDEVDSEPLFDKIFQKVCSASVVSFFILFFLLFPPFRYCFLFSRCFISLLLACFWLQAVWFMCIVGHVCALHFPEMFPSLPDLDSLTFAAISFIGFVLIWMFLQSWLWMDERFCNISHDRIPVFDPFGLPHSTSSISFDSHRDRWR